MCTHNTNDKSPVSYSPASISYTTSHGNMKGPGNYSLLAKHKIFKMEYIFPFVFHEIPLQIVRNTYPCNVSMLQEQET